MVQRHQFRLLQLLEWLPRFLLLEPWHTMKMILRRCCSSTGRNWDQAWSWTLSRSCSVMDLRSDPVVRTVAYGWAMGNPASLSLLPNGDRFGHYRYSSSYWNGRHHSVRNSAGVFYGHASSWTRSISVSQSWKMGMVATREQGRL